MIKHTLEGLSILPSPPQFQGELKAPVVRLQEGLVLTDDVFECPTLLIGSVGSGKSCLLEEMMIPILNDASEKSDNVFIFCAKKELIRKFKRPQDIVISVDSTEPKACWNIFCELKSSKNPELAARNISKSLTRDYKSKLQPFFENAANDILYSVIMAIYEDGIKRGITYTNWHLYDFLNKVSLNKDAELSWFDLARTRPERFGHIIDYFGDGLDQGYGIISEIRTLMHDCFWGSFCSDRGEFSAIESLKTGRRIFLYYDHANASEASIKIFKTILNLLFKHSVDEENKKKSWFFLDEFSLLPSTDIIDSMSLGRSAGFRLACCIQSAQLMTRHYKEDEAKALLSLFPNIICLKVQDAFSRKLLSDRCGEAVCSYTFNSSIQKVIQHTEHSPVVADYDFALIQKKGDAIMNIPNLCSSPFYYHGHRQKGK